MTSWGIEEPTTVNQLAEDSLENVSQGFDEQLRQAELKAEYDALLKETKYNEMLEADDDADSNWLNGKPSTKLMTLFNLYQMMIEKEQKPGLWFRLKWSFALGWKIFSFLNSKATGVITSLGSAYYYSRKAEIEQELQTIVLKLQSMDIKQNVKDLPVRIASPICQRTEIRLVGNRKQLYHVRGRNVGQPFPDFFR